MGGLYTVQGVAVRDYSSPWWGWRSLSVSNQTYMVSLDGGLGLAEYTSNSTQILMQPVPGGVKDLAH